MKLLLCKNVEKLGIVGDVVDVRNGYARNYLLPQGLATEPTAGNMKALAEARRIAERELAERKERMRQLVEKLEGVEVTIRARANEQGHLYGSVGAREIVAALDAENYFIKPEHVVLRDPIKQLDNVPVEIRLDQDLTATIKVWVVREKVEGEEEDEEGEGMGEEAVAEEGTGAGMEAGGDGDSPEQ